ncbi:class I SAM-dependent methyltransferase [Pseudomonas sp. GD04087]|uniref:class I SAM-dependent methyltransferase n=1 Tax=unclassified Pseudomonas TaxID=196821 RepID=UPI0024477F33|nr:MULTISPECIES: class I SAM-dependent methyltransferase [unclassified Pseudomonas]MDH0288053.1 class I SAM-dependent methyltransferase [Pseudomonas sp. GD04087]MDH1049285.1 class I SAM-dependent methyltransferase [Pseudomonas sp. GD03903]MDH2003899.1 class I SAM-dependent methyltransferase [Pseudomonas sp. GD03691]
MAERIRADSAHITPSAHYTGYVWYRHQLADPAFATAFGRWVHGCVAPINWGARIGFGLNIEDFLLQRHLLIDARLTQAIELRGVTQVVEIACGLSPRGRRFRERYPQLTYLEADLPPMAARKSALLEGQGWLDGKHRVRAVDILAEQGEQSLAALLGELDPDRPVAVITEGLVNYFQRPVIEDFWLRLAAALRLFPEATYLTELYPDLREHPRYRQIRWGVGLIGKLTRGGYPLHYRSAAEIEQAFIGCGFGRVGVLDPQVDGVGLGLPKGRMPSLVRVVEARV